MNECVFCGVDDPQEIVETQGFPYAVCADCWGGLVDFVRENWECKHAPMCEHCADEVE